MPDFKSTSAKDNPHPDKVEAQRERDRAQIRKEQADASAAAGTDNNRDAVERETKQGRGAAGINTGPSDTMSADPHNPRDNKPLFRPGQDTRTSDGMGASPPQGAQPTSDKPAPQVPIADRAGQAGGLVGGAGAGVYSGSGESESEAQRMAREEREARQRAEHDSADAKAKLGRAEGKIADSQSPGPNAPKISEDDKRQEHA